MGINKQYNDEKEERRGEGERERKRRGGRERENHVQESEETI